MRRNYHRTIIITIACAVGLAILGRLGVLGPVTGVINYTTTPIRGLVRSVGHGIASVGSSVSNISHLQSQNAQLKDEVSSLKQQLAADTEVAQQNKLLRQQLQVGEASTTHLVAADVIGYQPDNFRQFLTIAKGSNDGLKVGMAVVSNGVLVGTLSQVGRTTAEVFVVTDPNFKTNGIDQTSRASGTVQGQLGAGLVMNEIPQGDSVQPGDTIVTSGLGGALPKGIIIGQVESVNQSNNQVFQSAQLGYSIKINKLELVFVVVSS